MAKKQVYWEDVEDGMELPSLVKEPNNALLFMHCAVTWNSHRIHYDKPYAETERHPDVLVVATQHGSFLAQILTDWIGTEGRLRRFAYQNRARAFPGDTLTITGTVTNKYIKDGEHLVDVEIAETSQNDEVCAPGSATVMLPSRGG